MISPFYVNSQALTYVKGLTRDLNKIEKHPTYQKAVSIYRIAREKLLDVNNWKYDTRLKDFGYALMDENGHLKYGQASEGDYIRFKATAGEQFSWVLIERILEVAHNDWQSFAVRLKEITPVDGKPDLTGTGAKANTNTLIIERNGCKVVAYVHQRNVDLPNSTIRQSFLSRLHYLFFADKAESNTASQQWETLIDIIME